MFWILYALLAHVTNGLVFVVDKGLLGTGGPVSRPARYAAYSGLVAAGAAVLLLFNYAAPNGFIVAWSLLAGVLWVAALWLFFTGLKLGEPSRVVPITGSTVPVFTLLFAALFLGEHLAGRNLLAVWLLIIGGALLSVKIKGTQGVPTTALFAAVGAGVAFAAHFAVVKLIYDHFAPFLAAFAYVRMGVGLAAAGLLGWLWLRSDTPRHRTVQRSTHRRRGVVLASVFLGNKLLGTVALILQNYAISLGSVTVVNALQGVQYAFVLLLAVLFSRYRPQLFREEVRTVATIQKVVGIALVGLGLVFVV